MNKLLPRSVAVILLLVGCSNETSEISYPTSEKIDFVETIHGYEIEDQYRWLEDFTSEESKKWVDRQNKFTKKFIGKNEFKKAIKHYNFAIKSLPEYPIALNNLASAQQRLLEYDLAYETYQKVLVIDPKNKTAIKKSKELEKRNNYEPYKGIKDKGF